ncbi:DUF6030 family protein [Hymenobacter sp. B1770]|uniref:DUF6030 family protein n=1 Tax=Hymenobacter sp. B1770 TaxID=1718788 RepID=UPI003CF99C2C
MNIFNKYRITYPILFYTVAVSLFFVLVGGILNAFKSPDAPIAAAPPQETPGYLLPDPATQPPQVARVKLFNDPDGLRRKLSTIGVGALSPWHYSEEQYASLSEELNIGSPMPNSGLYTNIFCYVTGEQSEYADQVDIQLDIFNETNRGYALAAYKKVVSKAFTQMGIPKPKLLVGSIGKKNFEYETADYTIQLTKQPVNIESYKLRITPNTRNK